METYTSTNINTTNRITVIDDIMGSGKTTMILKYINQHPEKRFLCVVPHLSECERYQKSVNAEIYEPYQIRMGRRRFTNLVLKGRNIVTTQSLVHHLDVAMFAILREMDYTLIIDECVSGMEPYRIAPFDLEILTKSKYFGVELDDNGFLDWRDPIGEEYSGVFNKVKRLCELMTLMGYKDLDGKLIRVMICNFPCDFFSCFEETYILTHLWEGSLQKSFFDKNGIKYTTYMFDESNTILAPYNNILYNTKKQNLKDLIHIYEGKLNGIGNSIGRSHPLSKSWFINIKRNYPEILEILKDNTESFFKSQRTDASENMLTTFKDCVYPVAGRGYTECYVPCRTKATNEYNHKKSLAYLLNYSLSPDTKIILNNHSIPYNEDLYALSNMLQWIGRSQIREGKEISVYIPSERMRSLLKSWLNGKI